MDLQPCPPFMHMTKVINSELGALLHLQNWMSSAFPIGAYSYSHGIESAIDAGWIDDAESVSDWIADIAEHGSIRNDAIFISEAHTAVLADKADQLIDINDMALALSAGAERRRETVELGRSFRRACGMWPVPSGFDHATRASAGTLGGSDGSDILGVALAKARSRRTTVLHEKSTDDWALPVVIGALTASHDLPRASVIAMAVQSSMNNLAWIATRLVPLGQSSTLGMLRRFEAIAAHCTERALHADLDDLGSCSVLIDIASLLHERQHSRICLT